MTRKRKAVKIGMTSAEVDEAIRPYLEEYGFVREPYKGDRLYTSRNTGSRWGWGVSKKGPTDELIWRRGSGALYSPLYLKIDTKDEIVHLEAWGLSRTTLNDMTLPFGPRVGEGVLEVPGLKRCLNDIEYLLTSNGKPPHRKPMLMPRTIWRRRPYSWQGWMGLITIFISIGFIFSRGSFFGGLIMAAIISFFIGLFLLIYSRVRKGP